MSACKLRCKVVGASVKCDCAVHMHITRKLELEHILPGPYKKKNEPLVVPFENEKIKHG